MGFYPLSPILSARVNLVIVPAGHIKRSIFSKHVSRLEDEGVVRLGDVSSSDYRTLNTFSPQKFPTGQVLYHISTSEKFTPNVESFPFELNREAQVVLALADGNELYPKAETLNRDSVANNTAQADALEQLLGEFQTSKVRFQRALVHQLIILNVPPVEHSSKDVVFLSEEEESQRSTTKTLMCNITARLLSGMEELNKDIQRLSMIESPYAITTSNARDRAQSLAERVHQRMATPTNTSPSSQDLAENSFSPNSKRGVSRSRTRDQLSGSILPPTNTEPNAESSVYGPRQAAREASLDRSSQMVSNTPTTAESTNALTIGRYHVVLGAMFLQCGRWPDAMRELSEGVFKARTNNDHLWHAKGLEYVLDCMLVLGWAEMYFQIPQVCYPTGDKASSTKFANSASAGNGADSVQHDQNSHHNRLTSLQALTKLIPNLIVTILTSYERASVQYMQEKVPQLLLSESRIRLARILTVMYFRKGNLDDDGLMHLVVDSHLEKIAPSLHQPESVFFRKNELSNMIIDAAPETLDEMPLNDSVIIVVGVASLLSQLGLERKQAFILKELLSIITPGLLEARKAGAAEMGIHPATGLSAASNGQQGVATDAQHGVRTLLALVGQMHGVPYGFHVPDKQRNSDSVESIGAKMRTWTEMHQYGDFLLKMEVLRSCIGICEALPDIQGVLTFTVCLLQAAKRTITLSQPYARAAPAISAEEQRYYLSYINGAVGAASKLGLPELRAEYWDDFLVRSIELFEPSSPSKVVPHSPQDLFLAGAIEEAVKKDPFIYNPFAKPAVPSSVNTVLVATEIVHFAVMLQNPFEFEVEIDRISLLGDGCEFEAFSQNVVLAPLCCQKVILSGKPMNSGNLKILGCKAEIRSCRERSFFTFTKSWKPKTNAKSKYIRQSVKAFLKERPPSQGSEMSANQSKEMSSNPQAETFMIPVLNAQPLTSIKSSTLSQPALMVLEGESQSFQITLQNDSPSVPVDLLLFTFQDSATKQLQNALTSKELSAADLYELQLQLAERPALRQVSHGTEDMDSFIPPGGTSTFTFEIYGKPGLLNGVIQIDYASLGMPRSEVKQKFYTRQIHFSVAITVNATIELPRCNILPFSGDFAWLNKQRAIGLSSTTNNPDSKSSLPSLRSTSRTSEGKEEEDNRFTSLLSRIGLGSHGADHCLFLLDLRNAWPYPLSISIQVRESLAKTASPADPWRRAYTVHETLQPGHISRVVLLMPKIFIQEPHASIPTLSSQRQFVVSASRPSAEIEVNNREAFWFREELLKYVRGSWRDNSTGREGSIDLRKGLLLNPRMIDAIRAEEVKISFAIKPSHSGASTDRAALDSSILQTGRSRFTIRTDSFTTLVVTVHNRSDDRIHVLLRLQPSLRDQPHNVALDLSRRFAWTGMLQRALHPPLEPGDSRTAELGVTALCEGSFEVSATVEEIKAVRGAALGKAGDATGLATDRRIWHAIEPCSIDAEDS